MPYECTVPRCGDDVYAWCTCGACTAIVAYAVAYGVTYAQVSDAVATGHCVDPAVWRYAQASLANLVLFVAQARFVAVAASTRGRFDDVNEDRSYYRATCCYCVSDYMRTLLAWLVFTVAPLVSAVLGARAMHANVCDRAAAGPPLLLALCTISVVVQCLSAGTSLTMLIFRAGCLRYVPPVPPPAAPAAVVVEPPVGLQCRATARPMRKSHAPQPV